MFKLSAIVLVGIFTETSFGPDLVGILVPVMVLVAVPVGNCGLVTQWCGAVSDLM